MDIGNPTRILDTRRRQGRVDRTYSVLSGLAQGVAGIAGIAYQEHGKDMERKAKNDLVNGTINPDLQMKERVYAETVAKGQALDTFNQLKYRVQSGEFDSMDPEDFQSAMNDLHKKKTQEYSLSKFSKQAIGAWNTFWVDNESTLTAGQAGKYRLGLKARQSEDLSKNLAKMYQAGNYDPQEFINTLYRPDYDMLSGDDLKDAALTAAAITANSGDDTLLQLYDKEFNFSKDPNRYKIFDTAQKKADRVKHQVTLKQASDLRAEYETKVREGTLTQEDAAMFIDARDPDGNYIVPYKELQRDLSNSEVNRSKFQMQAKTTEAITQGYDVSGFIPNDEFQDVFDGIVQKTLDGAENPIEAGFQLGQLANAQTYKVNAFKRLGTVYTDIELVTSEGVPEEFVQQHLFMDAIRKGYNNDSKFYTAIGTDAEVLFRTVEEERLYSPNRAVDETIKAGAKAAQRMRDLREKGIDYKISQVPEEAIEELTKATKKYLKEDNSLLYTNNKEDFEIASQDALLYMQQRYLGLRNRGVTHEVAVKASVDHVKGVTELFDGSLVISGGAAMDLGADNRYSVETLKNDPGIQQIIAEFHSSGWATDMPTTPQLDDAMGGLGDPKKMPDWEEVRLVPDYDNRTIVFMNTRNEPLYETPWEYVRVLNEQRRGNTLPGIKWIKKFAKDSWITQEEYDRRQAENQQAGPNLGPVEDLGAGVTAQDIQE